MQSSAVALSTKSRFVSKFVITVLRYCILLITLCCGVPKENGVAKTVDDPTGSHSSRKNIIVRDVQYPFTKMLKKML